MPRRDLFIGEKGLEFSLRCPHWRKEGNKYLVERTWQWERVQRAGIGGAGEVVFLPLLYYANQSNVVSWAVITGSRVSLTVQA